MFCGGNDKRPALPDNIGKTGRYFKRRRTGRGSLFAAIALIVA
jgi:hypothetical protein